MKAAFLRFAQFLTGLNAIASVRMVLRGEWFLAFLLLIVAVYFLVFAAEASEP